MKKFLLRYNSNNFIWFVIWANRISICARWSVASMTGWGEQVDTSSGADRHLRLVFRNSSAMHLSWFITDEKSLTCKTSNFCPFCWFFFLSGRFITRIDSKERFTLGSHALVSVTTAAHWNTVSTPEKIDFCGMKANKRMWRACVQAILVPGNTSLPWLLLSCRSDVS